MDYSYWIARIQASRTSKFDWRDQPIYFHPDTTTPANMAHAHRALQALGARQVDKVAAGQVFVVLNPTDPPEQAKAVATLVGGLLCTFDISSLLQMAHAEVWHSS